MSWLPERPPVLRPTSPEPVVSLRGSTWTRTSGRSLAAVLAGLLLPLAGAGPALASTPAQAPGRAPAAGPLPGWLVQASPGALPATSAAVVAAGGRVTRTLSTLDALTVVLPAPAVGRVLAVPGVLSVEPDARVRLAGRDEVEGDPDSLWNVLEVTGAHSAWRGEVEDDKDKDDKGKGAATPTVDTGRSTNLGQGVDVALIDSGISPVPGLDDPSRIVNGPDLSFENGDPALRHRDTYGHGTHLAGILLGRDGTGPVDAKDAGPFVGVAPPPGW